MSAAPSSTTWGVTITNPSNKWAEGRLVVDSSGNGKYKGNTVTWDNGTSIGWSVVINHSNTDCTVTFSGGTQSGTSISGGSVSSSCFADVAGGTDTWSASETTTGGANAQAGYKGGAAGKS